MASLLCHCGPSDKGKQQEITTAPTSKDETGLLIETTDSDLKKIKESNEDIKVRPIANLGSTKIVEVIGSQRKELIKLINTTIIEDNTFFKDLLSPQSKKPNYQTILNLNLSATALFNPIKNVPSLLKAKASESITSCLSPNSFRPAPKIVVTSDSNFSKALHPTIELGKTVSFSLNQSSSKSGKTLKFVWHSEENPRRGIHSFPEASQLRPFSLSSDSISFTPDVIGGYTLLALAQDSTGVCSMIPVHFIVSSNPDYSLKVASANLPKIDPAAFSQLAAVKAQQAWKKSTGEGTLIAILDSGVNYNHIGISKNIHIKKSEQNQNQSDDDNNGLIDDFMGWDFINGDNHPFDDAGHGSHVAGLAASPLFGVAPKARVLPVKVISAMGDGDAGSIAAGIFYAADSGAHIINLSLGLPPGADQSKIISKAITYARQKGSLVIVAAGNDRTNIGLPGKQITPASLPQDNILCVAASDLQGNLTNYSNYNKHMVDIAAPGGTQFQPLFSLSSLDLSGDHLAPQTGTSMASPVTAGVAALVISANPSLTAQEVIEIILTTGRKSPRLRSLIKSESIIDAQAAVNLALSKTGLN